MENYNLYSHQADFPTIATAIKTAFPDAKHEFSTNKEWQVGMIRFKKGLFFKDTLEVHYRQRQELSYQLNSIKCMATYDLSTMYNFIEDLPTTNFHIKRLLKQKIETINSEARFFVPTALMEPFLVLLKALAEKLEGIIYVVPQNKRQTPHFLNQSLDLIMDSTGKVGNATVKISIDPKYEDAFKPLLPDQIQRKARSEQYLAQHQIRNNEFLPPLLSAAKVQVRSKAEIIERLYALVLIVAKGEDFPPKRLAQIFGFYNINSLSPYEEVILKKMPLTRLECAYATWRYEAVNVLLWALGFVETLDYPDKISEGGKNLDFIFKRDRETLETAAKLRSTAEILDELDKIYRLDWVCIIARFHQQAPEGNLEQGVIVERHYTLNWLTNYHGDDWDKINVHQL